MRYAYLNSNAPIYLAVACVVFLAVALLLHFISKRGGKVHKYICFIFLGIFFALRVAISYQTDGHADMTSFFLPWSYKLAYTDFWGFYLADVATGEIELLNDYPPMLMYVLWGIGSVVKTFNLSSEMWIFIMRIPTAICDIVASYYILKIAILLENRKIQKPIVYKSRKSSKGEVVNLEKPSERVTLANMPKKVSMFSFSCMVLYLANIAMITDTSWWGQVDGVTSMFFVLTMYNLLAKKDMAVVITAIVALCFKLQYIFFLPALGMYYLIRLSKEKMPLFKVLLKGVGVGVGVFFLINLPLCLYPMLNGHPFFMLDIYINQVSNYSYYTLNASNIYGALNLNFVELEGSSTAWTLFVVGGISIVVAVLSFFGDAEKKVPILGALTIITVFMFSYKMHERYMIYSLVLLLVVYLQSGKLGDLLVYVGFTCVQFFTIASIMCIDGQTFDFSDKRLQIISIICLTLYVGYVILISQAEVSAGNRKLNKAFKR